MSDRPRWYRVFRFVLHAVVMLAITAGLFTALLYAATTTGFTGACLLPQVCPATRHR
ncbi:hypothetical protein Q0Z83_040340 [Actinoplanes sichuanensis]|uniref:Uncharacterized protein n=1 Tax=Actinoplanes sichuanensis TaxID=512349 RepID=A0ABW4A3T5_9ACTN|nr:hypothetical protein [Actinoplanes sichuanensis]BEL05843.1 hypothetical protein Q0Z83_040340 [Actinoplanes sichuanensis]